MSAPAGRPLIGRWCIVEADRRDHGHLGLASHAIPKAKRHPFFNNLLDENSARDLIAKRIVDGAIDARS